MILEIPAITVTEFFIFVDSDGGESGVRKAILLC
jgi:hypothetical protein